ncbi:MAG TPA: iron uptake system protein EfeO [Acidimicrobiales bacterium]
MRRRLLLLPAVVLSVALGAAACSDDGAGTRDTASGSGSGSGSGSASGSGSGSKSGSAISVNPSVTSSDPLVNEGAATYTQYVRQQVDELVTATKTFTDAVRAGNIQAAKDAYATSRQAWERIEPIAGLVEDIDASVDARVDDFANEDDPKWTGWHKLEYLLWVKNDISQASGAPKLADQLDADIAKLKSTMDTTTIPASAIPSGAADLIEEVSEGKLTGEEDRYSGTDLWDFAANVAGSKQAFEALKPALQTKNPELVTKIEAGFADIQAQLQAYGEGSGYRPYSALTDADKAKMKTTLAGLSENLAEVAGALGLQ